MTKGREAGLQVTERMLKLLAELKSSHTVLIEEHDYSRVLTHADQALVMLPIQE